MSVLEVARLRVRAGSEDAFEDAFEQAASILRSAEGQLGVDLTRVIVTSREQGEYLLLAAWRSLEDHVPGFTQSAQFATFFALLGPHLAGEPQVNHYEQLEAL